MSPPELNDRPSPVRTIARTSPLAESARRGFSNATVRSLYTALDLVSRASATPATGPSRVTRTAGSANTAEFSLVLTARPAAGWSLLKPVADQWLCAVLWSTLKVNPGQGPAPGNGGTGVRR